MRSIKLFICVMLFRSLFMSGQSTEKVLICYGEFSPEEIKDYDYVIVEPFFFQSEEVMRLISQNKTVLAYISLGEVSEKASYFKELTPHTIGRNHLWESQILDLENAETFNLLDSLISQYRQLGFHGAFLDNIDNYTQWGPTPEKLHRLISFMDHIRKKDPEIHLMQNAGLEILDKTAVYINSLAIESVATNYNFDKKEYQMRKKEEFTERLDRLSNVHQLYRLPIIPIEYAKTTTMRNEILKRYKTKKWSLFIGPIELNTLPEFQQI